MASLSHDASVMLSAGHDQPVAGQGDICCELEIMHKQTLWTQAAIVAAILLVCFETMRASQEPSITCGLTIEEKAVSQEQACQGSQVQAI